MSLEGDFASLIVTGNDSAIPLKSLVFKPKTSKSAVAVPIVVIALQSTSTPSSVVACCTGTKEPRLANDELFKSHFGVENSRMFNLSHVLNCKFPFKVLVDSMLSELDGQAVIRLNEDIYMTQESLHGFLQQFECQVVEFYQSTDSGLKTAEKTAEKKAVKKESVVLADSKLIGITVDKDLDFSGWYQQILVKGEMLEYYDISGCYIMRPASYAIWEAIQRYLDDKIKNLGVQNAYFPMFVSSRVLEREKDHIEGFAAEVAWVTKAGSSELEKPIAIRPTSETIMYSYYAKWVRSYRDLPIKLNQWNSVVRWEFKHPQPFLRAREFLWQEGHTAHLNFEEAEKEMMQILDFYVSVYKDLLAVPVIKGRKTELEKFAGSMMTTTCEGYIPQTGRGIQGATSHHLGQNFSKMFNLSFENPLGSEHPKLYAYQNSWGLSTRAIGIMIMIHSDNKGLVTPPRVSQYQVVILPVGITAKSTDEQREKIYTASRQLESRLKKVGIRVFGDYNDNYTPGWKFAQYELKGIPLRLEYGPKDMETGKVIVVRRNDFKKYIINESESEIEIPKLLETMQNDMYIRAKQIYDAHKIIVKEWKDFIPTLNNKNVILAPWCGISECEDDIKYSSAKKDNGEEIEVEERSPSMGAKSLCIPFEQPELELGQKCIKCDNEAIQYCMFGRSY